MGTALKKCTKPGIAKVRASSAEANKPAASDSNTRQNKESSRPVDSPDAKDRELMSAGVLETSVCSTNTDVSTEIALKGEAVRRELRATTCCVAGYRNVAMRPSCQRLSVTQRPRLTAKEVELLTASWGRVRMDLKAIGTDTFVNLFSANPHLARYFHKFLNVFNDSIRTSDVFYEHVLIVMTVVRKVVEHVQDNTDFDKFLHCVGDIHQRAELPRKNLFLIIPFFVNAFKREDSLWSEALENAWLKFFQLVCHIIGEKLAP